MHAKSLSACVLSAMLCKKLSGAGKRESMVREGRDDEGLLRLHASCHLTVWYSLLQGDDEVRGKLRREMSNAEMGRAGMWGNETKRALAECRRLAVSVDEALILLRGANSKVKDDTLFADLKSMQRTIDRLLDSLCGTDEGQRELYFEDMAANLEQYPSLHDAALAGEHADSVCTPSRCESVCTPG